MKRSNGFVVEAILVSGILAVLVAALVRSGALLESHQRWLDRSFAQALAPYGKWAEDGWYKANLTDQWVKRDLNASWDPIANPRFKYMAYACKVSRVYSRHGHSRSYQAIFNDGLADLVIEVVAYDMDLDVDGPPPDRSDWKPDHPDWNGPSALVVVHYDGRAERLETPVALSDPAKREIVQTADEMAQALRVVFNVAKR